jgi:hypothetical protein
VLALLPFSAGEAGGGNLDGAALGDVLSRLHRRRAAVRPRGSAWRSGCCADPTPNCGPILWSIATSGARAMFRPTSNAT